MDQVTQESIAILITGFKPTSAADGRGTGTASQVLNVSMPVAQLLAAHGAEESDDGLDLERLQKLQQEGGAAYITYLTQLAAEAEVKSSLSEEDRIVEACKAFIEANNIRVSREDPGDVFYVSPDDFKLTCQASPDGKWRSWTLSLAAPYGAAV